MSLFLITIIAGFLRFYNLMWGNGSFFHPDERNMAIAVTKLCFNLSSLLPQTPVLSFIEGSSLEPTAADSCSMNPHFYAYGQFPLYLAYFSYQIVKLLYCYIVPVLPRILDSVGTKLLPWSTNQISCSIDPVSFPAAVFWLRFWSALASTLAIPVIYLISKKLINKHQIPETEEQSEFIERRKWQHRKKEMATSKEGNKEITKLYKTKISFFRNFAISKPVISLFRYFKNWDSKFTIFPLITAALVAFTPGLIQAAHFGTTESLLTFFFMAIIYFSFKFLKKENLKYLLLTGIISGIAMGTKLSAVFFISAPILTIVLVSKRKVGSVFKKMAVFLLYFGLWTLNFGLFFFLSSPYNFLAFQDFTGTSTYETHVAQGKALTFYTSQFAETVPIVYQLTKIFPYALGPALSFLGILGFLLLLWQILQEVVRRIYKKHSSPLISNYPGLAEDLRRSLDTLDCRRKAVHPRLSSGSSRVIGPRLRRDCLLITPFLVYFLPNAFLFCKWTRFMTPIMPFFAIFAGYFLSKFKVTSAKSTFQPKERNKEITKLISQFRSFAISKAWVCNLIIGILVLVSIIPGLLFFTIYTKPDIRAEASEWIYQNIPDKAYVLSETANVVDIPVDPQTLAPKTRPSDTPLNAGGSKSSLGLNQEPRTYKVISFDFYHLNEEPKLFDELITHLEAASYIFIPSHRIFDHRLRLAEKYPLTAQYYNLLFSGQLGFEKTAHFSRLPDEQAEETWSVFDHPAIRIYKKIKPFSKEKYQQLLKSANNHNDWLKNSSRGRVVNF